MHGGGANFLDNDLRDAITSLGYSPAVTKELSAGKTFETENYLRYSTSCI